MFTFDNSYSRLPEQFFARTAPTPVAAPAWLKLNHALARRLGLDPELLGAQEGLEIFAGNRIPQGAEPLAMAYAGHQFGSFVAKLGDGRAILLGELIAPDAIRFDLQLKGCGRTPFSRSGDGRAWIGPVLREYLLGEAMQALGIPTTRALAAVTTGESVYRETPLPGAVLTRIARSHVRVGTFEYFRSRQDEPALQQLADFVIARQNPELQQAEHPYAELIGVISERQAELMAAWLGVGFIHGVMNTDNMSVAGETLDYGPCAFMDHYDPTTVFSSIDYRGRYAYANQPRIARWNLSSLALSLCPLLDPQHGGAQATAAVDRFQQRFEQTWLNTFAGKLGISTPEAADRSLINAFLDLLYQAHADFTNSFRALCAAADGDDAPLLAELGSIDSRAWCERWRARLDREPESASGRAARMRRINPAVIPRNHRVEQVLDAALEGDLEPFERLLEVLTHPWEETDANREDRRPPSAQEQVQYTFCGT